MGEDGRDPLVELSGTALRVYLYLYRLNKPVSPRELQRAMGFRSVSTAYHHLERLAQLGLVEKKGEGYVAKKPRGLLGIYVRIGGRLLPRAFIYSGVATGAALGYTLAGRDILAALLLWVLATIAWLEAIQLKNALSALGGQGGRQEPGE